MLSPEVNKLAGMAKRRDQRGGYATSIGAWCIKQASVRSVLLLHRALPFRTSNPPGPHVFLNLTGRPGSGGAAEMARSGPPAPRGAGGLPLGPIPRRGGWPPDGGSPLPQQDRGDPCLPPKHQPPHLSKVWTYLYPALLLRLHQILNNYRLTVT